ncbi:von Willebrand factor type A [Sphaerospermopsis reniformis]|uniref:von Willebrand factor type A n=1 Tax=Sphaerospermopsis reniformis TaxID=531300 RepID=A0A479ZVY6_9CYAN|nr:VWA domain-containing protein [Sphaerospermopsis reniformis]GCL35736.1 von Willebrand factor type A [Sphaerospermopsis reniformis]
MKIVRKLRKHIVVWFLCGLISTSIFSCTTPKVDSFESAYRVLKESLLPQISIEKATISDAVAQGYSIKKLAEPLPNLEDFPLYGAKPSTDSNIAYVEIFGSAEKSNAQKQDERWLVDVAEAFNAKKITNSSGQILQVGIRNIPSGTATRILAAKKASPAGFSPSNQLLLKLLASEGVTTSIITPKLVSDFVGFVVDGKANQELAKNGDVTFEKLLDAILSGKITVGYPNPYSSSTSLNLLYTLFWRSAGHDQDGKPLTTSELQSPQVNSVFDKFQNQVLITTLTTLELKDIFIRDNQKLQAFPLQYQSYQTLKKLPGFEDVVFIPFGVPNDNPLVGFNWNTASQNEGLRRFSEFALSPEMQQLAKAQGFNADEQFKSRVLPPIPNGAVLKAAQSYWKQRKDGGRTVNLMMVIDTSGSMEGDRLQAVKNSLRIAAQSINPGNYVGLVAFSDRPQQILPLAPFNTQQHKRLLAAADSLIADGETAMYDGMIVGLSELMERQKTDPNGRFYLLLLSDGEVNTGLRFNEIANVLKYSGVRFYPIGYGEVNQNELQEIAKLRETTVKSSDPQKLQTLFTELLQTNL